jgi:hypothetical protein
MQKDLADAQYATMEKDLDTIKKNLSLVWVGIGGKEDIVYDNCRNMRGKFDEMNLKYEYDDFSGRPRMAGVAPRSAYICTVTIQISHSFADQELPTHKNLRQFQPGRIVAGVLMRLFAVTGVYAQLVNNGGCENSNAVKYSARIPGWLISAVNTISPALAFEVERDEAFQGSRAMRVSIHGAGTN